MECLFTKRELRLLDDLLPETKKNVRKGMIGQISRISKHNMAKGNEEKITIYFILKI